MISRQSQEKMVGRMDLINRWREFFAVPDNAIVTVFPGLSDPMSKRILLEHPSFPSSSPDAAPCENWNFTEDAGDEPRRFDKDDMFFYLPQPTRD